MCGAMGFSGFDAGETRPLPWNVEDAPDVAFATLWSTGPDTALDSVLRVEALRQREGRWERFVRLCKPQARGSDPLASARIAREHGLSSAELEDAPRAEAAWRELASFLAGADVVVASAEGFLPWANHLSAGELPFTVVGLDEVARLIVPARARVGRGPQPREGTDVARALVEVVARFVELPREMRALASAAWSVAHERLRSGDVAAASRLERALRLVDAPRRWSGASGELYATLGDGALTEDARRDPQDAEDFVRAEIDRTRPRCAQVAAEWKLEGTVPVSLDEPTPLSEADLGLVDDVFCVHLPQAFHGSAETPTYRKGQHDVAAQVARTLGQRKLLLVHAPTGTGKTLAYLVPAMLWSVRNNLRVAVSTYTRALQEQAIDNEVPRARAALARAGLLEAPRVAVLKGRANYLCWRAYKLHVPSEGDGGEAWLAWTSLLLFAWTDDDADLDRFPMRPALATDAQAPFQRELDALVRSVRSQPACCRAKEDRETCGAECARARAERCHVLITNHAFALIRPTYFKHAIFDECEHLHDQAGNAWSWSVTLREVREFLSLLRQPARPNSRAPLDRLEKLVLEGDPAWPSVEACRTQWSAAHGALDALETAIETFKLWREEQRRKRDSKDEHSLLREYVEGIDTASTPELDPRALAGARALVRAHAEISNAATELGTSLAQVAGMLDTVRARGMARIRRQLELARTDMLEWLSALQNWIPLADGKPAFVRERFYDVETDARGEDVLSARVLLPQELLGKVFYPALESGVLISATTWLRDGFEVSRAYLGLDRAAQPLEGEEREPSIVETFRAEAPFDYSRVVVCVPDDAPDPSRARDQFQAYVRRFVAYLGERTRGRMLVLFTNADEARRTGEELASFFRQRGIPLWFQGMPGVRKEELGDLFRSRVDSILFGVDTFWYGADFPGETLEYLVIAKLPYGVPDRYHHAQCAAIGASEQRRRIYLPRALAKFRQGFGRLMRRESDRGAVFVLDSRVLHGANRLFLRELPIDADLGRGEDDVWTPGGARFVPASTERCIHEALAHMDMLADVRRRGLDVPFAGGSAGPRRVREPESRIELDRGDVTF